MTKDYSKIAVGIVAFVFTLCLLCLGLDFAISFYNDNIKEKPVACPPLPKTFTESDLIGTWVGNYFGNIDTLKIRADGTYKQIYSSDYLSFESDWQEWYTEYDSNGYLRLHLAGMRRCDGLESECNDPGGGLPTDSPAVNPCSPEWLAFNDEVILFVTGTTSDVPLGIMLKQPRLAGADFTYTFTLEK